MKTPRSANPQLTAAILEIVENQLRDHTPPETSQTFQRLLEAGHSTDEAKRLIGCVVTSEIYDVIKNQKPFNQERFVAALHCLPTLPWESQSTQQDALSRQRGVIHFAGTETATEWRSYMEGALQSAERAAAEITHAIRPQSCGRL